MDNRPMPMDTKTVNSERPPGGARETRWPTQPVTRDRATRTDNAHPMAWPLRALVRPPNGCGRGADLPKTCLRALADLPSRPMNRLVNKLVTTKTVFF